MHKLWLMVGVNFVVMFALMYMMVDSSDNVYLNLNQFYMAATMTSAMMVIEMLVMGGMYEKKGLIIGVSAVAGILFFMLLRNQSGVSDREFLRSMIPHHGAALLMCNEAKLNDPEIKKLCDDIISGQQSQIDWMKTRLESY